MTRQTVRCSDRSWRLRGKPTAARYNEQRRFWAAIRVGRSSVEAAIAAGVAPDVGTRWFREAGGMPPSHRAAGAPALSGRYLSFEEREEIALHRATGLGVRAIARQLTRSPSTISRELRRNAATSGQRLRYRAIPAQSYATQAARRPKTARLAVGGRLRTYVQDRLAGLIARPDGTKVRGPNVRWKARRHGRGQWRRWSRAWSPQQISERLQIDFPEDPTMHISHEAIYQALYVQGRGALRRELTAYLRTGRVLREPRARTRRHGRSFVSPEIMISERAPEAADRAVPGHWEGDLIMGVHSSAIGTLVERSTRFLVLLHLPSMKPQRRRTTTNAPLPLAGHGAVAVREAIAQTIGSLPEHLRRSLTWDQGSEMAQHAQLRIETGIQIYFCDPRSPWQRGTNENTNGLLRQYFPKNTNPRRVRRRRACGRC